MAKPATKQPKGKVVAAAMAAGGGGTIGRMDPRAIEAAMGEATEKALAKGITDPAEIIKLKLAAREKVKAEHKAAEKKALAAAQVEATKKDR